MKETKEPKEVGFVFEEIPLQDALTVIASGDGKYSDLIIMLSKKLPELEQNNMNVPASERKSFSFGLAGGKELEEKDRRKLCNSVSLRLRKGGVNWRIHYSGNRKLFICAPTKVKDRKPLPLYRAQSSEIAAEEAQALELRKQGLPYSQIAAKMGILESRVSYICGKKPRELLAKQEAFKKKAPGPDIKAMIALRETGATYRDVGEKFGKSETAVQSIFDKARKNGAVIRVKGA